jgi:predicted DNA-binding protein
MPTQLTRINLTVGEQLEDELQLLSRRGHKSLAGVAKELIEEALELREEIALARLANKIDKPGIRTCSHEDFWAQNV